MVLSEKLGLIISSMCSTMIQYQLCPEVPAQGKAALVGELAVPCTCNPLQQG